MAADPKIIVVAEEPNLAADELRRYWAGPVTRAKALWAKDCLIEALRAGMVVTITDPKAGSATELNAGGDTHG